MREKSVGRDVGGWSMIGLLIGAAVGLLVLGGAAQIYVQSYRDSVHVMEASELNQELRQVADFMARDIRRAGYWVWPDDPEDEDDPDGEWPPSSSYEDNFLANPFWKHGNDLTVGDFGGNSGACILFAYDIDRDTLVGVSSAASDYEDEDNRERLGFRWGDADGDGVSDTVEARTGGGGNLTCTDGAWESIIDPRIEITDLTFAFEPDPPDRENLGDIDGDGNDEEVVRRRVTITLAGRVAGIEDPKIAHEIRRVVSVRNHKVQEVP